MPANDRHLAAVARAVESSGLDPHADRLLAIAAIGVQIAPGHAQILLKCLDQFEDLGLNGHIERRGGLVGDQ